MMRSMGDLQDRNTIAQVAAFWDCSVRTVKRRIKSGELGCLRMGRVVRITRSQVGTYEKEHVWPPEREAALVEYVHDHRAQRDWFEMGRIIAGRLLAEKQEREAKGLAKPKKPRR